jgi:hypothetical protein
MIRPLCFPMPRSPSLEKKQEIFSDEEKRYIPEAGYLVTSFLTAHREL